MFGFTKSSKDIQEKSIFYHEDHSNKEVNEALVGRKGKSLFELRDMDVPVPTFFVISPHVFKKFLLSAFDHKLADLMDKVNSPDVIELEKLILNADFDKDFLDELSQSYTRLSGFSDAWVGVRSSVVFPQREDVSFSGIFKTELNVKGIDHLVEAIKHVYISIFKNRVLVYGKENGIDISEVQMAVVIQKMIQPEVSGIAYTLDPVTQNNKRMSIEAVFGLGDVIADGSITPDQYVLNKRDLEVIEKHISPQEWMKIRKPGKSNPGGVEELQKIQISKTWSHQQKIEDENVKSVAKVALIAEETSKKAQSLEWVWESGNVWVLQSKPILTEKEVNKHLQQNVKSSTEIEKITEETVFDVAIDIVKDEKLKDNKVSVSSPSRENSIEGQVKIKKDDKHEVKALNKLSNKMHKFSRKENKDLLAEKDRIEKQQLQKLDDLGLVDKKKKSKLEFLLTGIGSSHGEVAGEIRILDTTIPDNLAVTKGTILLLKNFSQEMESFVIQSGGILMDEGGLTSDVAILCRENGIPAVVGTGLASALLKDGDIVKIDGNVGSVYKVSADDTSDDANSIKVSDAVAKSEEDFTSIKLAADRARAVAMVKESSENYTKKVYDDIPSKIITATKVMLYPEEGTSVERYQNFINLVDGVCYVDLDELMLLDKRHPLAYVESKTFREYSKSLEKILDGYTDVVGGSEVVVSIGSATVDRFRSLVKGSSMEDKELSGSLYGAQHYLSNPELFSRTISIIKKVRNVYKSRNLSLAVHSPMNGDIMKSLKKEISASGLKRTGTFNIYAVIDNPAEVILSEDILDAGIDGLILNTPRLARSMQGLPLYGDNVKYDIGVSSVNKILESAIKSTRGSKSRVIVVVEGNELLMKRCIEWGVYGIAVSPENFNKSKRFVADEEARMIMGIGVVTN
jgi:phosphoenolpyruvate synthase/pyruvate phosphate dikinase